MCHIILQLRAYILPLQTALTCLPTFCIVMAHIVMAYIVMAYIVMAYDFLYSYGPYSYGLYSYGLPTFCIVMAHIVMAYIVMAYIAMVCILPLQIALTCLPTLGCGFGLYSHELHSHGLFTLWSI